MALSCSHLSQMLSDIWGLAELPPWSCFSSGFVSPASAASRELVPNKSAVPASTSLCVNNFAAVGSALLQERIKKKKKRKSRESVGVGKEP